MTDLLLDSNALSSWADKDQRVLALLEAVRRVGGVVYVPTVCLVEGDDATDPVVVATACLVWATIISGDDDIKQLTDGLKPVVAVINPRHRTGGVDGGGDSPTCRQPGRLGAHRPEENHRELAYADRGQTEEERNVRISRSSTRAPSERVDHTGSALRVGVVDGGVGDRQAECPSCGAQLTVACDHEVVSSWTRSAAARWMAS